jgi:hypothetical protein
MLTLSIAISKINPKNRPQLYKKNRPKTLAEDSQNFEAKTESLLDR